MNKIHEKKGKENCQILLKMDSNDKKNLISSVLVEKYKQNKEVAG